MRRRLPLFSLLVAAACGGGDGSREGAPGGAPADVAAPAVPSGERAWSNARGFFAVWRPTGGSVPLNEEFDAEVFLFEDESCSRPIEGAELAVDCRMPAHQHGMLRDVDPEEAGGGRYVVRGMLCHMLGHWELHLDLRRGAVTERAQFDIELE